MRPSSVLRVVLLSATAFAIILGAFKLALPQLQLGFVWRAVLALPLLYLYLFLVTALCAAFPQEVRIYRQRLVVQQGQHLYNIDATTITRARLVVFANDRIRLRVWYTIKLWKKPRNRQSKIGVSPKVSLEKLCEVFPAPLEVWDARAKYAVRFKTQALR